jgi:hypothetical protein
VQDGLGIRIAVMKFYWLTLGALAVWRITHLLNAEDGPRDLFLRLRRLMGDGFGGDLLDCFYCLSLWIAAPLAWWLGDGWKERLLLWLALSAGGIVIERLSSAGRNEAHSQPSLFLEGQNIEEGEDDQNVLLRKEERRAAESGGVPGSVHQSGRARAAAFEDGSPAGGG